MAVAEPKICIYSYGELIWYNAGVSILQENLNYSLALNIICQILLQILSQLSKLKVPSNQEHRPIFF